MKIFISHATKDKQFVETMLASLPKWITTWVDKNDLLTGDNLDRTLLEAIQRKCDYVVIFISDNAIASEWVTKEAAWAKERQDELERVFLLPVLLNSPTSSLKKYDIQGSKAFVVDRPDETQARELAEKLANDVAAHSDRLLQKQRYKGFWLAAYIALLVAGAAGGTKLIPLWRLAASVSVLSYACTFFIGDCVNQIYGQREARKFLILGFCSLLLATGFMTLFVYLPAVTPPGTPKYLPADMKPNDFNAAYRWILQPPFRIVVAGLTAYVIGQTCNLIIYSGIRKRTGYPQRGWRNVGATLLSQAVDTLIFIPLAFLNFEGWTIPSLVPILAGQFLIKAFVASVSLPIFLLLTDIARRSDLRESPIA